MSVMVGNQINNVPPFSTTTVGTANGLTEQGHLLEHHNLPFSYEGYANLLLSHVLRYNEVFIEWFAFL